MIEGIDNKTVNTVIETLRNRKKGNVVVLDEIEPKLPTGVERQDVIEVFKVLDGKFGSFIVGRSGYPTRFELDTTGDVIIDNIRSGFFNGNGNGNGEITETTFPIPLRGGEVMVEVKMPLDLSATEAKKVASVIEAIGFE